MHQWAMIFCAIAALAAVFGFGATTASSEAARVLFFVFSALSVGALIGKFFEK